MSQLCFWEAGGLTYLCPCLRHRVPQAIDKPGCSQVRGKVGLLCRAFLSVPRTREKVKALRPSCEPVLFPRKSSPVGSFTETLCNGAKSQEHS